MSIAKVLSLDEVKKHNSSTDLWIIIEGKVYDLTKFRAEHPGGEEVLDELGGKDGTKDFNDVGHSEDAKNMMTKYYVGDLEKIESSMPVREIAMACAAAFIGFTLVFMIKKLMSKH
ncbi:cytochrome b5 [Condylostylus longicornis]|uniref:cytochrome b5 n=1 Tax=Condylostylus longicornis TaxID=2530218 RepID=UPI00244E390E|nr:cytochrome b5 [Condylostylus longicornis]